MRILCAALLGGLALAGCEEPCVNGNFQVGDTVRIKGLGGPKHVISDYRSMCYVEILRADGETMIVQRGALERME